MSLTVKQIPRKTDEGLNETNVYISKTSKPQTEVTYSNETLITIGIKF